MRDCSEILVSIIVPVFNVEKYLNQCIDSVINQTHKKLEVLLVDDGSTDRSGTICDEYSKKHSYIKTFHKSNGGLSSARNYGINRATGEYLFFLDSDDWIEKDTIEEMLCRAIENECMIACCEGVRTDGKEVFERCFQCKEDGTILSKEDVVKEILINTIMSQVVKGLYKKECWIDVRFPLNRLYEDVPTTYHAFENANKVIFVNKCFYNYRYNNSSISYTPNPLKSYHIFLGFKDHYDYAKTHYPDITLECLPNPVIYALSTYFHYCSDAKEELEPYQKEVKHFLIEVKNEIEYKAILKSRRLLLKLFYFSDPLFKAICKFMSITGLQKRLGLEVK